MFSGQRLKEIREAQGMSQASVAKHLGIVEADSQQDLDYIEEALDNLGFLVKD